MADGYRFPQQSAGNYYYPQHTQPHHPRHQIIRNSTPPNNIRSIFSADTPSPSRSPDSHSPAPNLYGMFNQSHQQGQHGRINGGPGGRAMPIMYNNQYQSTHQHHAQHHANIQQDHNAHTTNGTVLGHHTTYSSGVLSNSTPSFTPNALQNGHSTPRGGQVHTEHWQKQIELYKDSGDAHRRMMEGAPNHFARSKAGDNKGIAQDTEQTEAQKEDENNIGRMSDQQPKERQDWHNMDLSGQGLRILTMPVFNYVFLKELYVASNKLSYIPAAIRHLRFLTHLDASNNQLSELPPQLGICVYLESLYVFDNQIRTLPTELGSLFRLEMLGIEGNPLDSDLKQDLMENGTRAVITSLRENGPVPMPPKPRELLSLLGDDAPPTTNQETFKVFSFNILSDQACTERLYGYSPSEALNWNHRKEQVLQEIETQMADFVCLQEVDTETFKDYFSMRLAYKGYKGVFWARSRAKTMSEKDAKNVDGCATFYKSQKYILLDKQLIDFATIAINRPDMKNQHDIFNRIMPRDHIAVVSFFENRLTGTRLILVNTHFYWDPRYADVKLIQAAILIGEVNRLADKYVKWPACKDKKAYGLVDENTAPDEGPEPVPEVSKEYSSKIQIPLVICADQNSTKDSSVFELFSKGTVSPLHPEIAGHSYGNFTKDGIDHPFALKSAYTNLDQGPEELPFTNFTPSFRGVIDHIWYSTNALENISLLGQVDPEYMEMTPGFPNYHFPSDHLSLMAEFGVKGSKAKKTITEPDFGPSSSRNDRRRN